VTVLGPLAPIRLIAVDVDGTLIGRGRTIPTERVGRAVRAAARHGVQVALCSGRPLNSIDLIGQDLGVSGPVIGFDGALVLAADRTVLLRHGVRVAAAIALIDAARSHGVCLEIYRAEGHYVDRLHPESVKHAHLIRVAPTVTDLRRLALSSEDGDIIKAQVIGDGTAAGRARLHELESLGLGLRFGWAAAPPGHAQFDYVNVTDLGVDKGRATAALIAALGLSRDEVMGLGDGPNDAPLLGASGFAVAMGNAGDDLKRRARFVVPHVDDDGAAIAIERFILDHGTRRYADRSEWPGAEQRRDE